MEKKRERVRRGSWLLVPILGIGLAYLAVTNVQGQKESEDRFRAMRRSLRGIGEFHSVEYRINGDQETVLREDWVGTGRRRVEYFDGQFVIYHFSLDGKSEDLIYEPSARVVRRHYGANVVGTVIERLTNEMLDRSVKVYGGPENRLVLETVRRKHVIEIDEETRRPKSWETFYFTDEGEQPLSRTEITYGEIDRSKLEYDPQVKRTKPVDIRDAEDRYLDKTEPVANIGKGQKQFGLMHLDVNHLGDVFYVYRSPYERPFVEVTANGETYSKVDVFIGNPDQNGYPGEQMAIRLQDSPTRWPLTVKFTVRADARYDEGATTGEILGTYTQTFEGPTCFMPPAHWFNELVSDGPLYDYLRTRHYRLALTYQNLMRAPDGAMVDTISGGLATLESPDLKKDPKDLQVALEHAREMLRVRTEFDAGRISMGRVYILIAELYVAMDQRNLANRAISFARRLAREGRGDGYSSGEIERAAKQLGL